MHYVIARIEQEQREDAFRIYLADSVHFINEHVGRHFPKRYSEMLNALTMEYKPPEEVVKDVIKKGGLQFGKGGNI